MHFSVISLFPEMIDQASSIGVVGQARSSGLITITTINPREFTQDVHHSVDDRPFGGGDGMVMMAEPLKDCMRAAEARGLKPGSRRICLSARGRVFDDALARELAQGPGVLLVCGRYGGIDQRVIESESLEEVSIGDYVLSGGELGALVIIDCVSRQLPGVLGNSASSQVESFANGLLEPPQFTRPRSWNGYEVPAALLSGHHAQVQNFKQDLAILSTVQNRADLILEKLKARELAVSELETALTRLERLLGPECRSLGLHNPEDLKLKLQAIIKRQKESGRSQE